MTIEILDDKTATLTIDNQKIQLSLGVWSSIIELKFAAGFAFNIQAITQVILTEVKDKVSLYSLPSTDLSVTFALAVCHAVIACKRFCGKKSGHS